MRSLPLPVRRSLARLCAIVGVVAIAGLSGCTTKPTTTAPPVAQRPAETVEPAPVVTPPTHPLTSDQPGFLRMGNMSGRTPVRVGVLLPFGSSIASTRALANTMLKAAELAMFDSGNREIVLMTADEGANGDTAAASARKLLDEGAEVIIGPIYATSVRAVAPITRDRAVPLIAFSTDRAIAGDGVYLLSFQPADLVNRVVRYAAASGHKNFAAIVPSTAYGDAVDKAFRKSVEDAGGKVSDVERYSTDTSVAAATVARSDADAILIGQGGAAMRAIGPQLRANGVDPVRAKLLGSGLWEDTSVGSEPTLDGTWFAAPTPSADDAFNAKYRATFGGSPPQLATLSYDAVSLIALLAQGTPYRRFTFDALTDPNGFIGVNGIFRFHSDGSIERGLAIMSVSPNGFITVDPAPRTFQRPGS